jgi:DNA-directed RNA polymerase III subunit RPC3
VRKKYGQEAFTIFRLLVRERGPVETDKIIDTTILDKQIVHGTLYKLWKDDYIDTEVCYIIYREVTYVVWSMDFL